MMSEKKFVQGYQLRRPLWQNIAVYVKRNLGATRAPQGLVGPEV